MHVTVSYQFPFFWLIRIVIDSCFISRFHAEGAIDQLRFFNLNERLPFVDSAVSGSRILSDRPFGPRHGGFKKAYSLQAQETRSTGILALKLEARGWQAAVAG
ncbi:hypothetical protein NKY70_28985 [Sinorhizobium meliloti]|uniref:hypothetical protein n=1 Tax=Rhizobium meliloti TaxID=382 RepID=UPI003D659C3A